MRSLRLLGEGVSRSDKRTQMSLVTLSESGQPVESGEASMSDEAAGKNAVAQLSGVEGDGACRKTRSGTERPRMPTGMLPAF
jgi:hypothetical protein